MNYGAMVDLAAPSIGGDPFYIIVGYVDEYGQPCEAEDPAACGCTPVYQTMEEFIASIEAMMDEASDATTDPGIAPEATPGNGAPGLLVSRIEEVEPVNAEALKEQLYRLLTAETNFKRDLANPDLSDVARSNIQKALAHIQRELAETQLAINPNATGTIANGLDPIATMDFAEKLYMAIEQAVSSGKLGAEVEERLMELLEPEVFAMMVGYIVAWAAAHGTPAAPVMLAADVGLTAYAGKEVLLAMNQLYLDLSYATTPQEMQQASDNIAEMMSGPMADVILLRVLKAAGRGARKFHNTYEIKLNVDPNTLGMNGANAIKITKRDVPKSEGGLFSVVPYRPTNPPFKNHHGILDVWATFNITGYISRGSRTPAIALTEQQHDATNRVFRDWLFDETGKRVGGRIDWTQVSARSMQDLANRMFDAAGVPEHARRDYFRAFHQYIYGND